MKEFWDQRYSSKEYVYGKEPNTYFRKFIESLSPGQILLPGEGEGRNAVFAASLGWEVMAVDQSSEGRCKALALAEEKGVLIQYQQTDLESLDVPTASYDVVSLVFVHLPPNIREKIHQKLVQCLRPGGIFHLLAFTPEQLRFQTGGPQDVSMLYTEELLRADFTALASLDFTDIAGEFKEGPFHQGEYRAIELVGTR